MPFHEILKQTLSALWETKLRSFLTMFGIVWGITSVILLVGLGIGFNVDQKEHLRSIGTDIAIFFGGKTGAQAGGYAAGRDIRLTIDDAIAIQQQATLVKTVSPELRRTVAEVSQWNAASRAVRGVWPQYQRFRSLAVEQGRLMTEQDEATYSAMARDFPPPERPGIVRGFVNNIVIEPVSPDLHEKAVAQVKRIIAERHHYDPNDKEALWIWDTLEGSKFTERIFGVMTLFFGAVALLTLALGAVDIKRQFLVESAIITLVSGIAGLALGVGVCLLLKFVPLPDFVPHPVISPLAIAASLTTLTAITLFAGMYPALRAADLSPMDCLRAE